MLRFVLLPMLVCLLLAACAREPAPAVADCSALAGWRSGLAGQLASACSADEYGEAHRLGTVLHGLRKERDALAQQAATAADEAERNRLLRARRQKEIDIEAIEGVAQINGWR